MSEHHDRFPMASLLARSCLHLVLKRVQSVQLNDAAFPCSPMRYRDCRSSEAARHKADTEHMLQVEAMHRMDTHGSSMPDTGWRPLPHSHTMP
jgi:hypothetical protein